MEKGQRLLAMFAAHEAVVAADVPMTHLPPPTRGGRGPEPPARGEEVIAAEVQSPPCGHDHVMARMNAKPEILAEKRGYRATGGLSLRLGGQKQQEIVTVPKVAQRSHDMDDEAIEFVEDDVREHLARHIPKWDAAWPRT